MEHRLRTKVWLPNIDSDIEKWCRKCNGCQLVCKPKRPEPMQRTALPLRSWDHLAADYLGPLPTGVWTFIVLRCRLLLAKDRNCRYEINKQRRENRCSMRQNVCNSLITHIYNY